MMNVPLLPVVALLACSTVAAAAPAKTRYVDASNGNLIDAATAKSVMDENIPARVWRVYPATKYVFASQVEGGMSGRTCVVTARVMLLPLTPSAKAVLFRPHKVATAYDAVPDSGSEQCRGVARAKLKEATVAVVSSLVRP